jgi:hypothetical protein
VRSSAAARGDRATADWIACRLRDGGYETAVSTFDAPFFNARVAQLSTGGTGADVIPQAPVVSTSSRGVTARLALVENGLVTDVRGRIALVVTPFGRHAALFPDRGIGQTVIAVANAGATAIVCNSLFSRTLRR